MVSTGTLFVLHHEKGMTGLFRTSTKPAVLPVVVVVVGCGAGNLVWTAVLSTGKMPLSKSSS